MAYGAKGFFEINEYHCCILTLIHVKIPVTCTFKQASNYRLLGEKRCISVKVVIKLIVNWLSKALETNRSTEIGLKLDRSLV